jgi:ABC-2 type transport system permease protein
MNIRKMGLVFWHEYAHHVMRKRFIIAVLSMPIFIGVILVASILSVLMQTSSLPLGYVDLSGTLAQPAKTASGGSIFEKSVEIRPFATEDQARSALQANQIQAYYVIAADYPLISSARLVYLKQPSAAITGQFEDFVRANLLAGQSPQVVDRLTQGNALVIQSVDGSRKMDKNSVLGILLPIFAGVLLMIVVLTSGGYLLQALVEEKENRTIEILITSTSPGELMAGKTLGNLAAGLTQLVIWLIVLVAAFAIGQSRVEWMRGFQISPDYLLILVATLLPTFLLIGGIMAAIGATIGEAREAQQISGMFTLPIMAPYWFTAAIMTAPNGPLAVGLSFFPLTAPVTIMLRSGFTQVPTGQLIFNLVELWVFAIIAMWIATRAFRIGMLSYGKRISIKQVFRRAA